MNLQDIFDELTYGELSQLAAGGRFDESGNQAAEPAISEENRPQIVRHISTALTALYTRFRLREKAVLLQLQDNKSNYVLDMKFATTNTASDEVVKYLVDSLDDPFDNSLIKVEQVSARRVDLGLCENPQKPWHPLVLNESNDAYSVRTTSMKTLLIPEKLGADYKQPAQLKIEYRAIHTPFDMLEASVAPSLVNIDLPTTHLQALLFHVASRIMNPTGMTEEFHAGNSYYAKYEGECARLELENVQIDQMPQNTNFERQGFR